VTVTPSPTITTTVTSTPTSSPTPTATPTLADLLSYLPAILNQVPSPTPTPSPSPTPIPLGIHGYVTLNGVPVGGVFLDLRFYDGSAWSTYSSTITAGDGSYSILNVPSLNPGEAYYIRYINTTDPSRLFTWHTNVSDVYQAGSDLQFETFDISNVYLINPASGAGVELPFTFQWIARPFVPTDNYEFDLFDYNDYDPLFWTYPALGYVSSFSLSGLPDGFEIGVWYGWDIWILPPSGNAFDGYGLSYYFYYVFFVSDGQIISVQAPQSTKKWAGDLPVEHLDFPMVNPDYSLDDR